MSLLYKPFRLLGIALCAVFLMISAPSMAAQSVFIVEHLEIDITAASASDAKKQAFSKAQTEAFEVLKKRMLTDQEIAQLTRITADAKQQETLMTGAEPVENNAPRLRDVSSLIKDFEVTKEKLSRVRYIGTYTIRFKERAVRDYFEELGFSFTDIKSQPTLILPLYRENGETVLWAESNEWLKAWNRTEIAEGLVPVIVPIGDLDDVRDIGNDDALTYSKDSINHMLRRYGAGKAVIAIASNDTANSVVVQLYNTQGDAPSLLKEVRVTSDKDGDALFDKAVGDVFIALQRNWKAKTKVSTAKSSTIRARVPIKSLKEWADTQKALRSITIINDLNVKSLSPKEATIDLSFKGSEARLKSMLRQQGITLKAPLGHTTGQRQDELFYGLGLDILERAPAPIVYDLYLNKYSASVNNSFADQSSGGF